METTVLLKQVRHAEKNLTDELESLNAEVSKNIQNRKLRTRRKLKETLDEGPRQVIARKTIEHMQLRLELLRNMRMNWRSFEKHAHERDIDLRINQFSALQHLIHFLETGEGEESTEEVESNKALMAYEVQPTGAGKTGAFAIETALLDVPTLILVPFDNLVEQTKEDLIKIGGIEEGDIGLVYGGVKEFGRTVTVATYQGHAAQMKKKNGEYAKHIQNNVKFCICDEVHTSLGERTQESLESIDGLGNGKISPEESAALKAEQEVLRNLNNQVSVKALKVGYTATPKLAQKHVKEYFPHFLGRVYHKDMVEAGILVPYKIVQCNGAVSEGEIGSYITEELEVKILNREKIYEKLLGEYVDALHTYEKMKRKNAYPLRGMAFCTNHAECEKFSRQASELGLRCEIVTGKEARGKVGREVIKAAKEKLCGGEIDLIVTVEKLCAGFNFPEVNAVIWARITSMAKTIQGIGRGGRSHKEGKLKKDCCWVFETNWTLKKNAERGRKPLRIADALAQNGENPEAICTMADGTKLIFEKIISSLDENGVGLIEAEKGISEVVGINAYANAIGGNPIRLQSHTEKAGILPIGKIKATGGFIVDAYLKSEIDDLAYVQDRLHEADEVIDENGIVTISINDNGNEKYVVGIAVSAYARYLKISGIFLLERLQEAGVMPVKRIRSKSRFVDIYLKEQVDSLNFVSRLDEISDGEIDSNGVGFMQQKNQKIPVIVAVAYAVFIGMNGGVLKEKMQEAGVQPCGKVRRGISRIVEVFRKEEVDAIQYVQDIKRAVEVENGVAKIQVDKREIDVIGVASYATHIGMNKVVLLNKIAEAGILPVGKVKSGMHVQDAYPKKLVDAIPYIQDALVSLGNNLTSDGTVTMINNQSPIVAVGISLYALLKGKKGYRILKKIEKAGIKPVGKARNGPRIIDVYSKNEIDELLKEP